MDLDNRVKMCEASVGHLRKQLIDKDKDISDLQRMLFDEKLKNTQLQREFDEMAIKLKAANGNVGELKEKLQNKDDKVMVYKFF